MFYRLKCRQTLLHLPKLLSDGKNVDLDKSKVSETYPYCGARKRKYSSNVPTWTESQVHDGRSLVNRFLFVKTLKDLYGDVPGGVVMDTAYADSRPNGGCDSSLPVIVGLHDTPGDHKDLLPLLEFFAKLGCRAVCPTFPGHGQTKGVMRGHDDIFSQSTIERATFVSDFLSNLDIERVDILVGIGASCYTAMALCTLAPEVFKATALISPWPLSQPRINLDADRLRYIKQGWDSLFFRPPLKLLLSATKLGDAKTVQEKIALIYLLANLDFGEVHSHSMILSWKKLPYVVAYGAQDGHVDKTLHEEMLDTLGINSKSVTEFNGVINKINIPGTLVFPDSGYHILTEQRSVLCAYLLKLLQTLHPSIKI